MLVLGAMGTHKKGHRGEFQIAAGYIEGHILLYII
jgi:hypothetical protein